MFQSFPNGINLGGFKGFLCYFNWKKYRCFSKGIVMLFEVQEMWWFLMKFISLRISKNWTVKVI